MAAGEKTVGLSPARAAKAANSAAEVLRGGAKSAQDEVAAAVAGEGQRAAVLATALSGHAPAALTCRINLGAYQPQLLGPSGLVPRAQRVRKELQQAFGDLPLGGFAPGGISEGHMQGSAHYDGRAIDIFFRPVTPENQRQGWATAHWLVAHADRLGITTVIYNERIWSVEHARRGWREYQPPESPTGDPTLLHRDHVHVTVTGGTDRVGPRAGPRRADAGAAARGPVRSSAPQPGYR